MVPSLVDGYDEQTLLGPSIDTLLISLAILDESGRILVTNQAWHEFASENDIQMQPDTLDVNYFEIVDGVDDEHAQQAADGLWSVLSGEKAVFELEYPCHSPSTDRWFLLRAAPFAVDGSKYVSLAHINITERKQREQALRNAYDICTDSDRTFSQKIDALLELGRETLDTDFGTLSHVHGEEYVFEAVKTPPEVDLEDGETVLIDTLPNCKHVFESREPLAIRDVKSEAPELADPEWGISNYIGAPVVVGEDVYGTFCFYGMEPRDAAFTQWDMTFVQLLSDWVSYELEQQRRTEQRSALSIAFPDPSFVIDAEGRYLDCLTSPETMTLVDSPESLIGQTFHDVFPAATADSLLTTVRTALRTSTFQSVEYNLQHPSVDRWFEARVAPLNDGAYDPDTVIFVARDITAHKQRQNELERQRDELEQAQRLNVLGREIAKALQGTQTRKEIESAVCTHLTDSDLYRAVWTGTREDATTVTPIAAAGVAETALSSILPHEQRLAIEAIEDGEVHVIEDITPIPTQATAGVERPLVHDCSAIAAVPLTTGETTYGVLMVYAPVDAGIGCREVDILADLGRLIALSIQRVHSQRSLMAATAVELEFLSPDSDVVFAEISAKLDCTIEIEQRVPTSDGTSLHYVRVRDTDPDQVCQLLRESPSVDACAVIEEPTADRAALVEVAVDKISASPLDAISDYGGVVTRAVADGGVLRFSVEMASEVDVRAIVEAVQETAAGTELRSKRYLDQPVSTATGSQSQMRDRLTQKQAATLKAAYARGYYDWPRKSSAKELAETLDISAPTLHYRLRKAHEAVISSLLDSDTGFEAIR